MNLLSVLSTIIYTSFFIGAIYVLNAERKSTLNLPAAGVLLTLGWWSFANSFFFSAQTAEQAMLWHRLSSIGWCGFVAFTAFYFLVLTDYDKRLVRGWKRLLFFFPAMVLIAKNLLGSTTSLAQRIIPSTSGWGWTYENSFASFWLWAYLIYVALYFGLAFYLLVRWAKSVSHKMKKEMAFTFIVLDAATLAFGIVTDVIFPLTQPVLPALASVGTALFGLGYFCIIYRFDVFNINLVISADDILQTGHNPIFVMDETGEILKSNNAAAALLGYRRGELIGMNFSQLAKGNVDIAPLFSQDSLTDVEAHMYCKNGTVKSVMISASVAKDKRQSFICIIVSCQDVSRQKKIQAELEFQQQQYKHLAEEYQQLAYYDPLTALPNRLHFYDILGNFERLYQTQKRDFAVLFLDLNHFKSVNDQYGHKAGDELLKETADRLSACLENGEFAARLGGDEFTLIMPCEEDTAAQRKMQLLQKAFRQAFVLEGGPCKISVAIGFARYSDSQDVTKIMQQADKAMYKHKKSKKLPNACGKAQATSL